MKRALVALGHASVLVLLVAACGGGGTEEASEDSVAPEQAATTTSAPDSVDDTTPSADTSAPDEATDDLLADGSDIDWATVDLTTIDWANIDMNSVDFEAIGDNPTAENLQQETLDLIASRIDPGSATLTIGDQTWEFASFVCAFGHDATQSAVYSFSSDSRGEHEGARVQMQANIRDESGQGRYEGDGLTHEVFIQDISDFENPSISLDMNAPGGIVIDGNTVTADGVFDDELTPEVEEMLGTLEATCGTTSRR